MRTKLVFILLVAVLTASPQAHAQKGKALTAIFTLLTGAGAAKAFMNADEALSVYKEKDQVLQNLKAQGLEPTDLAIYSIYFSLNGDVSSVYWADVLNKPDIFGIVQIEGYGTFLVPSIQNEYAGQALLWNIVHKKVPPGRRILIHIMDDDSFSNEVWNNILGGTVEYRANAQVSCRKFAQISLDASGKVRLLDRKLELDAADYIATAAFVTPASDDSRWSATGVLYDSKNREVGKLQFAQIWRADPNVARMQEEEKRRAEEEKNKAHSRFVFWSVLGGVALLVGITILFSRNQKPGS